MDPISFCSCSVATITSFQVPSHQVSFSCIFLFMFSRVLAICLQGVNLLTAIFARDQISHNRTFILHGWKDAQFLNLFLNYILFVVFTMVFQYYCCRSSKRVNVFVDCVCVLTVINNNKNNISDSTRIISVSTLQISTNVTKCCELITRNTQQLRIRKWLVKLRGRQKGRCVSASYLHCNYCKKHFLKCHVDTRQ